MKKNKFAKHKSKSKSKSKNKYYEDKEDSFNNGYHKKCPECEENSLVLIVDKKISDGVTYFKKYLFCSVCEYKKEYKQKGCQNNKKENFVDEE